MRPLPRVRSAAGPAALALALALVVTGVRAPALAALPSARPVQVQTPGQDSIPGQPGPVGPRPDTIQAQPGAAAQGPAGGDTLVGPDGDTLEVAAADSLADSVDAQPEFRVRNLPDLATGPPAGWVTGIWEWDRERLRATRALNLLELLEDVPGVLPLRGGDYGQPAAATAFGLAGGRIRVFWDGVEMAPVDGAVVDLSRVGIAGLETVRVVRSPGELRIELKPFAFSDPRPYSFLEVGTGDLETNIFRGVFAHPDALGGSIVLALDRLDTGGTLRQEPGVSFGGHLRHTLFFSERFGMAWEFHRMTSRRPASVWELGGIQRTDWSARARYRIADGVVAGLSYQRSSVSPDSGDEDSSDAETAGLLPEEPRTQLTARVAIERERWWAEASHRQQWGDGWPSSEQSLRAGGVLAAFGGAAIGAERQAWDGEAPISLHARVWSRPFGGVSLFAEIEDGRMGVPFRILPPSPDEEGQDTPIELPPASFSERTGIRAGAEYRNGDWFLGAAILSVEADSIHPTGLPFDRDAGALVGGGRTGFEGSAAVPLEWVLDGLSLRGSAQFWDDSEVWPYLPRRVYDGRLAFHDVFLEAQNLEVWADLGMWGRDPMSVPVAGGSGGLAEVPFHQSWFGRLQIRVATVRVFVRWDNFTLRADNQDFPGRVLPQTRALYGIRWTMWN